MNCYFLKSVRKKYKEYQIRTLALGDWLAKAHRVIS